MDGLFEMQLMENEPHLSALQTRRHGAECDESVFLE